MSCPYDITTFTLGPEVSFLELFNGNPRPLKSNIIDEKVAMLYREDMYAN